MQLSDVISGQEEANEEDPEQNRIRSTKTSNQGHRDCTDQIIVVVLHQSISLSQMVF